MKPLRRSERVNFESQGYGLAGIIDAPDEAPLGYALFSHCFTCNKDLKAIVRISRRLAQNGWAVLRYDFRGLGNSQGEFSKTNFTTNLLDLQAACDFLHRRGQAPQLLIGHSFGGAASLASAQALESIQGVACIAAPSDTQHLADLLVKMDPAIESHGSGTVSIGGRSHQVEQQMIDDFRSHDLPAKIAALAKPVMIFHSPKDETVDYAHATRIYRLAQQSNSSENANTASIITLPTADHLFVNDLRYIDWVADTIAAWMQFLASHTGA